MSGHNKWSKIKHKKEAGDAKKSKEFGKFSRLIALESKKASGNASSPSLRGVIERARAINMPTTNIERAIKKGLEKDSASLEEVVYEAYGPGGSAIIILGLTDSKNRASAEIRHTLGEHGGSLATQGAASWAFEKEGDNLVPKITIPLQDSEREQLKELVEILEENDDVQKVYTNAKL